MSTETWFRNPHFYIKECLEMGIINIAWDRGYLVKNGMDSSRFMSLYYGNHAWRNLLIGQQGATEYTSDSPARPVAVYPVWEYGDDILFLEEMLENPLGLDEEACRDTSVDPALRPVLGQDHRIIITGMPPVNQGPTRKFVRLLREMQDEYPDATIHLHGLYSFRTMFGMGFRAADVDPRTTARKGKVYLPMGREMTYERAAEFPMWIKAVGFQPSDLKIPRNRCMFNMASAIWASQHFTEEFRFHTKRVPIDPDSSAFVPATNHRIHTSNKQPLDGDRFLCDMCSLQPTCKYFRSGAVCIVPDSEPMELAHYFNTRDSETIIEGLGTLLATETQRLKRGLEVETGTDKLDPEVTRIINTLFDRGVKLAKLVDPNLRTNPTLNFKFQQNNATIQAATPQQLMAAVVKELKARGVPLEAITPQMVENILKQPEDIRQRAIEAAVAETS